MLNSLFKHLREAQARSDVEAIVVTGANGKFSAGFDINQFTKAPGGGGVDMTCVPLLLSNTLLCSGRPEVSQVLLCTFGSFFQLLQCQRQLSGAP